MNKEILSQGIYSYKNVFQDSFSFVEKIEALSNDLKLMWVPSFKKDTTEENRKKAFRNVDTIGLPLRNKVIDHSKLESEPNKTLVSFSDKLNEEFSLYINDYLNDYGITVSDQEPYGLLRYGNGQKFDRHIDDGMMFVRKLSLVYYVNDEYKGGEIFFDQFNLTIKPEKNQLLLFPSNYIYTHSISEVTEGLRYSIVSWFK